ncbi:unnamed protein product [Rotaria magnacalcarata]|uniref:Transglycosylase SLT domain-containing protein n=1 Tax=Rotaria magnacalcarata TaxID=392030 RepID=A0A816R7L8_9BILA|nr:unnamed protein product [Rotaria magnacalcarata]
MINTMTQQNKTQGFFIKYKKWLIALGGLYLIPRILMITSIVGGSIYLYVNNDTNYHPFKSYIVSGFKAGHADGAKDEVSGQRPSSSLWNTYWWETDKLKKKSERGAKLAEMKLENIKLPLQLELDKRFITGLDFYADYVKQRIKRESFKSDSEYHKALEDEAWKAGYAFGYNEGINGFSYNSALICLCFVGNNALASNNRIQGKIKRLIEITEEQYGIPSGLLEAIAFVESGINSHAINVAGKPVIATNNNEALKVIADARDNGIRNIDVGVMQLNYRWHSNAFANIQEMLNPKRNIEYAAEFLIRLKKQHGTWY